MDRGKITKKSQFSVHEIMFRTVGILLVLTMFSIWLAGGLFAKYVISDNGDDSARVASSGVYKFELLEHSAKETYENSGEYELDSEEVKKNDYKKVLPGVDIPKDPFVRLELKKPEVGYELYIKVIESDPFPDSEYVTYSIDEEYWVPDDSDDKIYKYKDVFEANTSYDFTNGKEIPILTDNKLYVSEHYVGDGEFTLTFEAWLEQVG